MQRAEPVDLSTNYDKINLKILIPIFLIIIILLLFTAFYDKFSLTGNFIKGGNSTDVFDINADLTVPDLELKGDFSVLELRGYSGSYIHIGDQKFYLGDIRNSNIVLEGYSGEIVFGKTNISKLKGKAESVLINGVSMLPSSKDNFKILLEESLSYDFITIEDGVNVKSLSYLTEGSVSMPDSNNRININYEYLTLKDYFGKIDIKDNRMKLYGSVSELEVSGRQNILIR